MLFNSCVFLLGFLPLALAGFFAIARLGGARAAAAFLVAASLVFYGWWNPAFLPLLVGSIAVNYAAARAIAATSGRVQAGLLAGAVAANLGALVYFKYLADLLGFVHAQLAIGPTTAAPALPLGISFFTFTQIGYLVDCRAGTARARGLLDYLLFVTFFPHLIAGPILHHREIMPQFADPATWRGSARNLSVGGSIFLIGLLKKTLLADPLAPMVAAGFGHAAGLPLGAAWQAAAAYSLQLYFDFSGYSDMAIGLARMFNLRFPLNFNSPYKAECVIDYWQRWHMTLTRYLTLYLFNPLALAAARRRAAAGRKVGRAGQASAGGFAALVLVPIGITMTLAGIWHGSGLTFVVFGLLHAAYLTINHAWRVFGPRRAGAGATGEATGRLGRIALTYLAVLVGAVVFRAPSLGVAGQVLAGMAGLHGAGTTGALGAHTVLRAGRAVGWLGVLYAIVWGAPNTQQIMRRIGPALEAVRPGPFPGLAWRPSLPWALAMGGGAALGLLSLGGTSEFLYFRF
ncbi:MAG: MBOAT family protein [Proteobacteria bacterium]|nr:MBOAT family protein [Pseudomonadota bacterium]